MDLLTTEQGLDLSTWLNFTLPSFENACLDTMFSMTLNETIVPESLPPGVLDRGQNWSINSPNGSSQFTEPTGSAQFTEPTFKCINEKTINPTLTYISYVLAIICFSMILLGNGLILALTRSDVSFKTPVFYILRSLSVMSILSLVTFIIEKFVDCEIGEYFFTFTMNYYFYCYIENVYALFCSFCETAVLYHLLLLSILRIVITVFPLRVRLLRQKQVCLILLGTFIFCLLIEISFGLILSKLSCIEFKQDLTIRHAFYEMSLASVVILLLVVSMVISTIRARISAALLQTTSQRRQSKLASVVITTFTVFFLPLTGIRSYLFYSCPSITLIYVVLEWLPNNLKYAFYAFNPFILCLRQPSIRAKIFKKFKRRDTMVREST